MCKEEKKLEEMAMDKNLVSDFEKMDKEEKEKSLKNKHLKKESEWPPVMPDDRGEEHPPSQEI